jgi:hypothetical protein
MWVSRQASIQARRAAIPTRQRFAAAFPRSAPDESCSSHSARQGRDLARTGRAVLGGRAGEPPGVGRCPGDVRATAALVVLLLASCTTATDQDAVRRAPTTAPSVAPAERAVSSPTLPSTDGLSASCPVTLPNGDNPPGQASRLSHGNGRLWVALYPRGVVRTHEDNVERNGSLAAKFPWTRGMKGRLTITGRRLDASAPPLRSWVPGGYGRIGFQSSAVIFPTAGCWEVKGRVGGVTLTIVTKVIPPSHR